MAWVLPTNISIRQKYNSAMLITDQVKADEYLERCVQHSMNRGNTRWRAEEIERENLGYWAAYCSDETRERVERLFKCVHPVFGSIADNGPPTPEETLEMGRLLGFKIRQGKQEPDGKEFPMRQIIL